MRAGVARRLSAGRNRAVNVTLSVGNERSHCGKDKYAHPIGDHASIPHVSR
jgi:hypothetical protein